jgi:folate-dependent tRNA-U54 methylase TrmFO/GidA
VSHAEAGNYQPSNITHGIMAPLEHPPKDKMKKKMLIAERALRDLDAWQSALHGREATVGPAAVS